jgi:hypothetical protein
MSVSARSTGTFPAFRGRLDGQALLGCWRGDLATSPSGGSESVCRWVFFAVDTSQLDKASRLVACDSDHHAIACRGVDDSFQSSMCEWNGQREVATI